MEFETFSGFIEWAGRLISAAGDRAADMDGRAAFLLGMVTWFMVEQAVRRLAGLLRWAILAAALVGGGTAAVSLFGQLTNQDGSGLHGGQNGAESPRRL